MRAELDAAHRRVMESGWYILGEEVETFEAEWAAYCGTRHCVGVANGLDALELILRAWGFGPGDEVIVPANAYIACWLAVTNVGASPVPIEPDPLTCNLDPNRIEAALTPRTKAIMALHLYGRCLELEPVHEIARENDLRIVEDGAQAHGARYRGRAVGSLGDGAAFSFYPTKNLGAYGDAGAVTTDDAALADKIRLLRNYGSAKKYENRLRGRNSRLDPLQAAFLRVRLAHLDEWNERRRKAAEKYSSTLRDVEPLLLPAEVDHDQTVWHVYAVHHARRDFLQRRLAEQGVQTFVFYPVPPHLSVAYQDHGWNRGDFPIAESLASTNLALPIGPHLTDDDQEHVITTLKLAANPEAGT